MSYEKLLTKSLYQNGLQCLNYLWTKVHHPEEIPAFDEAQQYRFDQGYLVEHLAKTLFPQGLDLPHDDFTEALSQTKKSLKLRKPLFEASLMSGRLFARLDVLDPVEKDAWDIIEIKSSNDAKEEHYHDLAFQKHCCEKAGLKIKSCFVLHLNGEYIRKGEINPQELFTKTDVTEEVKEASQDLEKNIKLMLKIIDSKKQPEFEIGKACSSPHECPLTEKCWAFMPENNVFTLYRGGKNSVELFEKKIYAVKDIPKDFPLTDKQEIQRQCAISGQPHLGKEAIKHFLASLKYPLYFFDFESFSTAIPLFDHVKPWQNITFQYSLHLIEKENSKPKHFAFLAENKADPRLELLKALKKDLGDKGQIIVYNQVFEISRLKEMAEAFPEYKKWIHSVVDRIVDLLVPFRNFSYYHPSQLGSASIKYVLTALTGKDYAELEITGNITGPRFLAMYFSGKKFTAKEIEHTRKEMLKYCELDTYGEILVLNKLKELVK